MAALPHGTVTFLFTDIAGSTRLWQAHHEAMAAAYRRHDTIVREAVDAHGGVLYKTIGDALQVAFPTAPAAVAAALHAQLALQAEDWSAHGLSEPLRVRMALHTGAVDPDLDGDYRSPVLNRLGRLLGAGHGGQVLLSHITAELVRDHVPAGAGVRDLGEGRLKDLARPERIAQLHHPGLWRDFPPLRTLERHAQNLPVQPTPLIGREWEVEQLTSLLRQPEVRLLTLTGPGGTGKTRLALQAAADVVEQFANGVWVVELAPLTDPDLVPSAIAAVLGVREEGGQPLPEIVADYLREKQLLLVVDNLEHLVPGAAPFLGNLLAAAPHLTMLATSRVPLRLRAEREVAVPPLGLPRRKPPPTLAQLGQYEAVRLFIERVQAVKADFTVTSDNAPAVAEICHRLDGLPLAIELAAARIRMFPPEAMLRRLETRLTILTGGARDLPARQQTLRGAIAWSHELLSPDEQALFRRLSVFAGGASLEAIEAVVATDELGLDVFDGLERLVAHSLVRQTETEGEPRFSMLETIREFGLEELETTGETDEAHQRHAAYYLAFAEAAESSLKEGGSDQHAWIERLETEHDNLRSALSWALQQDPMTSLGLAGALAWFWWMRGHMREGRAWLEKALASGPVAPTRARAKTLTGAGLSAFFLGDTRTSVSRGEEALTVARELGEHAIIGESLFSLGNTAMLEGDFTRAQALFTEAVAVSRACGDTRTTVHALSNLGLSVARQGDPDLAVDLMQESLALSRGMGDAIGVAMNLLNLGQMALSRQDVEQAQRFIAEALRLSTNLGLGGDRVAEALTCLGILAVSLGDAQQAARFFGAADEPLQAAGLSTERVLIFPQEFVQAVAAARGTLGEDVYDAAHAAGAALSLEEAIAEALGVVEEIASRVAQEQG